MSALPAQAQSAARAHVIVVGNEEGGAGKSTLAMHLAVALLRGGASVGVIDLDLRQRTLSRYIENRRNCAAALPMPRLASLGDLATLDDFHAALGLLAQACAYVVIDTPGVDTPLSRAAHSSADTLITPLNDCVVDFDVLGAVRPGQAVTPSAYSEMVWQSRKQKLQARGGPIDWIVIRNRLSASRIEARTRRRVGEALTALSGRIGFRLTAGLSERAVFRDLFTQGLTLLDVVGGSEAGALKMAHLAARQELRDLLGALKLPGARLALTA
jgi:chromosome partitioning protein